MNISKIIYYTRENDKNHPISLRALCPKKENIGLETIFYLVKDAPDIQELLKKLNDTYYEHMELENDEPSAIRLKVVNAYDSINYLTLKKRKTLNKEISHENN
jgi:hypothetical protein